MRIALRLLVYGGLIVLAAITFLGPGPGPRDPRGADIAYDPAIEAELAGRGAGFAGLDRWAFPGMHREELTARLEAAGYGCPLPQDREVGGTPAKGVYLQRCTRRASWPAPRELTVEATLEYDRGEARITRLQASAAITTLNPALRAWGAIVRGLGVLEPGELRVTGLAFERSEDLARWVADGISATSWRSRCAQVPEHQCGFLNEQRDAGLPPVPATVTTMDLEQLMHGLADMGLHADQRVRSGSGVTVRVDPGGDLWIDTSGADLAGAARRVAVRVDADGARPLAVVVRQGASAAVTIAVEGLASVANGGDPYWLLPVRAGARDSSTAMRPAHWVVVPAPSRADGWLKLGRRLHELDPAYLPMVLRRLIPRLQDERSPEEEIGLYPGLQRIDLIATNLRRAQLPQHVAAAPSGAIDVAAWFPEQADLRLAWALARCEKGAGPPELEPRAVGLDEDCWIAAAAADAAIVGVLRTELLRVEAVTDHVAPDDPVRRRVARLRRALEIVS